MRRAPSAQLVLACGCKFAYFMGDWDEEPPFDRLRIAFFRTPLRLNDGTIFDESVVYEDAKSAAGALARMKATGRIFRCQHLRKKPAGEPRVLA